MATKTKKKANAAVTREVYEEALKGYIATNNKYERMAAERDKKVAEIDAKYGTQFEDMKKELSGQFDLVQAYCEQNRTELFPEKKSLDAFGATVGFREGTDKVVVLPGFTEKGIVSVIQKMKKWGSFVRAKYSLDKEALIREQPKGMEDIGLKVTQEESFYLAVHATEVPA